MSEFENPHNRDAHFSKRIRAGKRTYYFDVKATRSNDFYITITESKRKPGESEDRPIFEKHKLFLYKEDFDKFTEGLQEALHFIREKRSDSPDEDISGQSEFAESRSGFSDLDFDDLGK